MTPEQMKQAAKTAAAFIHDKCQGQGPCEIEDAISRHLAPLREQPQHKEHHEIHQQVNNSAYGGGCNVPAYQDASAPGQATSTVPVGSGSGEVPAAEAAVNRKTVWIIVWPSVGMYVSDREWQWNVGADGYSIPIPLISHDGGKTWHLNDTAKDAEIARLKDERGGINPQAVLRDVQAIRTLLTGKDASNVHALDCTAIIAHEVRKLTARRDAAVKRAEAAEKVVGPAMKALKLSVLFREFSDEWHAMDNADVVEFRRLRQAALDAAKEAK